MRRIILMTMFVLLCGIRPIWGDTIWTSGHHEIVENDDYFEIYMYNNATADMFGGEVYKLETFNTSSFDMYDGQMDTLYVHGDSTASIYSGSLLGLGAVDIGIGSIDLYAYDVIYHATGGYFDRGWLEGIYFANDSYFSFGLDHTGTIDHINVVPEPTTFILLALGGLVLRKKR